MANPFDQFDTAAGPQVNPFDQFDEPDPVVQSKVAAEQRTADVAGDILGVNDPRTPTQLMDEYEAKLGPAEGARSPAEITQSAVADSITWASDRIVDYAFTIGDAIIPDAWQDLVVDTSAKTWNAMMQKEWFREGIELAKQGKASYDKWAEENPDYANRLEEVVTIGALTRAPKTREGTRLDELVTQRAAKTRGDKVRKMMEPPGKKGQGNLRINPKTKVKEYVPSEWEETVNKEVIRVPKVDPKKPYTDNMNAVRNEASAARNRLDTIVRQRGGDIDIGTLRGELNDLVDGLSERTLLTGDAYKIGESIYKHADDLLAKSDGSALGVLQVRRDLDNWVSSQKNVFDSSFENATTVALKEIRDFLNDSVKEAVGGDDVARLLDKQNKLLYAGDRLEALAMKEADLPVGRMIQKLERATGEKFPTTPLAQVATIGYGAGKWALWTPFLPLVGGYKGIKWLATPEGRKALRDAARAAKDQPLLQPEINALIQLAENLGVEEEDGSL
jgi:stalled ribosome alternative rescue factor ArfA